MTDNTFGIRLKQLREEKGLTLDILAEELSYRYKANINKSTLSRWENGADPKLSNARYVCLYFDVSLDYMLGFTDRRTPARLLEYNKRIQSLSRKEKKDET